MTATEQLKERLEGKAAERYPNRAFDPTMWIALAMAIIEAIQKCRENRSAKQIAEAGKNPGFLEQVILRIRVRRALPRRLRADTDEAVTLALDVAKDATENDMEALLAEHED